MMLVVKAVFSGGPFDGLERYIDAPCAPAFRITQGNTKGDYFYAGFQDGVAYYSAMTVSELQTGRSSIAA